MNCLYVCMTDNKECFMILFLLFVFWFANISDVHAENNIIQEIMFKKYINYDLPLLVLSLSIIFISFLVFNKKKKK